MEDHQPNNTRFNTTNNSRLKKILRTETKVAFFPSSGTGCWEAALQSTLNVGDKVLGASFGQFSHLWLDMCKRLQFEPITMEEEWGTGANLKVTISTYLKIRIMKLNAFLCVKMRQQQV